jgi:hypothetical protein
MAYNSAHTGPEIDAAVEMLGQIQSARDATSSDRSAVETLASQVATNAGQVASQASTVSTKTAQVLESATAVEQAHAEVLSASETAVDAKDAAALYAESALASRDSAASSAFAASQSQLAAGLSEQISAENAASTSEDRTVVDELAQQVEADSESAAISAQNAAAVVTGGTATLASSPGKIPLADAQGKIDPGWLGEEIARTSAIQGAIDTAEAAEDSADLATARTARFMAPASTPPTLRDDGEPLQFGDRYVNTGNQAEYIYKSSGWEVNDSLVAIEALEESISVTPSANKTPRANGVGKLDIGWLPEDLATDQDVQGAEEKTDLLRSDLADDPAESKGSRMVSFVQSLLGSAVRSVLDKLRSIEVGLDDFAGVDTSGVADSTAGFQLALSSGAKRLAGSGVIRITETLQWPMGVLLEGNNQLKLVFDLPAGVDGIQVLEPTAGYKFMTGIRNTVVKSKSRGRYMFSCPRSANVWNRQCFYDFTGLRQCDNDESLTVSTNYWDRVLDIGDCRELVLSKNHGVGGFLPTDTDGVTHASRFLYVSATVGAIGIYVSEYYLLSFTHPFELSDGVEGHVIGKGECITCWDGLTYSNSGDEPGGFVDCAHFNASHRGIVGSKRVELTIGDISVYRSSSMATHSSGWSAVDLSNCNYKVTVGNIHGVPGSAVALDDSWAIRLTNCAAHFIRIKSIDTSLQLTGAFLLDSVSGFRSDASAVEGATTFCKVLNTYFSTTDVKFLNVGASNTDATLLSLPAGFNPTGIYMERAPRGAQNSPASISINASADFTIQPKAGMTTLSISGTAVTANVVLSRVGASSGDRIRIKFVNSAAAGHTINFLSGAAGTVLNIIRSGNSNRYFIDYEYNGSSWACNYLTLDLDSTLRT